MPWRREANQQASREAGPELGGRGRTGADDRHRNYPGRTCDTLLFVGKPSEDQVKFNEGDTKMQTGVLGCAEKAQRLGVLVVLAEDLVWFTAACNPGPGGSSAF